jgi:hypothetical protein
MENDLPLDVSRFAGFVLATGSVLFWLAWLLMPGVGVTDTELIFALVRHNRLSVFISVLLQLGSAAAFAPGVSAILGSGAARRSRMIRAACIFLLLGAMGSAADAIFHLVAYEMTAPGIVSDAVAPVMQRLQGSDLVLLLPFILSLFMGHALLIWAMRNCNPLARVGFRVLLTAPLILLIGIPMVRRNILPGRFVGLGFLATISGSLVLLAIGMVRYRRASFPPANPA